MVLVERLADIAMNQSLLLRIETGKWKRTPLNDHQLERLTEELDLNTEELKTCFENDRKARVRAKQSYEAAIAFPFEFAEKYILQIGKTKIGGNTAGATLILPEMINSFITLRAQTASREDKKSIDRWIAKGLWELVRVHIKTAPKNLVEGVTEDYIEKLNIFKYALKKRDEDREDFEMVEEVLSPILLYASGEFELSSRLLRARLNKVGASMPKAICMRVPIYATALRAELGQIKKGYAIRRIRQDEETILSIIDKDKIIAGDLAQTYEGLSNAYGRLDNPEDAQYWLDKAKVEGQIAVGEGTDIALVQAQIFRTEFLNDYRNPEVKPQTVQKKAVQAIAISLAGGLYRQTNQVINKLSENPNFKEFSEHLRRIPLIT